MNTLLVAHVALLHKQASSDNRRELVRAALHKHAGPYAKAGGMFDGKLKQQYQMAKPWMKDVGPGQVAETMGAGVMREAAAKRKFMAANPGWTPPPVPKSDFKLGPEHLHAGANGERTITYQDNKVTKWSDGSTGGGTDALKEFKGKKAIATVAPYRPQFNSDPAQPTVKTTMPPAKAPAKPVEEYNVRATPPAQMPPAPSTPPAQMPKATDAYDPGPAKAQPQAKARQAPAPAQSKNPYKIMNKAFGDPAGRVKSGFNKFMRRATSR